MRLPELLRANPEYRKTYNWLKLIGIPITAAFMMLYLVTVEVMDQVGLIEIITTLIITTIIWEGNVRIYYIFDRLYPWRARAMNRILLHLPASSLYSITVLQILVAVKRWIINGEFAFCSASDALMCIVLTLFVNSVFAGVYFYREWKKTMIESERLKREQILSQFEALKLQVNPHFLFNSLTTLVTLINEDQKLATKFVEQMSRVYRYVLKQKESETVQLATELEFLQSFMFLMKMRFGENLHIDIDIPQDRRSDQIAPLTLQMLFENAIKHNVITAAKPLHIRLYVDAENRLVVSNNLQPKSGPSDSTGVGLQNIINRYRILSHQKVEVLKTALHFSVSLPLLRIDTQ